MARHLYIRNIETGEVMISVEVTAKSAAEMFAIHFNLLNRAPNGCVVEDSDEDNSGVAGEFAADFAEISLSDPSLTKYICAELGVKKYSANLGNCSKSNMDAKNEEHCKKGA